MDYTIQDLTAILSPIKSILPDKSRIVRHLLTDSRSLTFPADSLFFAIRTNGGDGHRYIPELYAAGVRDFVVEVLPEEFTSLYPDTNFLLVGSSIEALHTLASQHRHRFSFPVIGITGSRGKTTVKEWLYQLLQSDHEVVRSPRSFNSHIGVPLSLWELDDSADLAIIEAGISCCGEMEAQARMIDPTIAVITNVGHEHDEGFSSLAEKCREKAMLAKDAGIIVYNMDDPLLDEAVTASYASPRLFGTTRKNNPRASLKVLAVANLGDSTEIEYSYGGRVSTVSIPFVKEADIENAVTVLAVLLALGMDRKEISRRMEVLQPVDTRLQVIEGVNNCMLLKDGYTSDLRSLGPALDFMMRRQTKSRSNTVILSDLVHESKSPASLYRQVASLLEQKGVTRLIGVGQEIASFAGYFQMEARFFPSTEAMLHDMSTSDFDHELILIKGAPGFNFPVITEKLEARQHETVLEVNLDAMMSNYNFFKSFLKQTTGIVAMVKASGYGAGSYELAKSLQSGGAAYLAVAAHDEGVDLRTAGITMPIMVLNPKVVNYPALFAYSLEPEIYDLEMLDEIIREGEKCGISGYPIHIKIDSGMHRLGFLHEDMSKVIARLMNQNIVFPKSIFSHLAAADDPSMDDYTFAQFGYFKKCADELQSAYPGHHILRHILNSTGIVRFPDHQMDMVRLGIGLYGIATMDDGSMSGLTPVSALRTVIISIKEWPAGTTIGYNRRGVLTHPSRIATIPIGYADGLDRHLGNGHSSMVVKGHRCPTVGNICMDVCMIDVTDCPEASVGDHVEIFGNEVPASELAGILDTIPYEILTSVSSRVKRVYYRE